MKQKNFIHENFLLQNKFAEELYHKYAAPQPIIDYHNHLPPREVWEDKKYENLTQVWIEGDHYKWRAMRTAGIDEKYITGKASDKEKFIAWAKTAPKTLRNPLYHWTHLELKRYFGISELLSEESAERIYEEVNSQLQKPENYCRGLLRKMNVESLCTTEDPTDDLKYHRKLAESDFQIKVSTAFRPDNSLAIEAEGFNDYMVALGKSAGGSIKTYQNLRAALLNRIEFFDANGCKLCDHGLEKMFFMEATETEVETIFKKRREDVEISQAEAEILKTHLLQFLSETYSEKAWVQQLHLGPLRNNNTRKFKELGPDTGWDSIGDFLQAKNLSSFLDAMGQKNKLAKTIIYNLNPSNNAVFASMIGNFNDGSNKGKVQFGSGWWFLDQKEGIIDQLNTLSNMGMVSCFVGMLTDSRSFLSFPRHEYFRRVLCNLFGSEMVSGEIPLEMDLVGKNITAISYKNANEYFDFK